MIKFIEWILGQRAAQIHQENREAFEDVKMSRIFRERYEKVGAAQRLRLEQNHVGEGFRLAFEAGQRRDRKRP